MLIIDDLTVRIAGRTLLKRASARIPTGARVGLVGRNGTGKTTLFGVIAGDISVEQGNVDIPSRWRIGRLAQEAPNGPDSLLEIVLKAHRERSALLMEAETAQDPHRIAEIQTRRRYRRARGPCPRGIYPCRPWLLRRRPASALCGVFRRLANARGARRDSIRGTRLAAPR